MPATFNKYYEPFFGSGCLFFSLLPKAAIVSDKNPDLIKTYKAVAKHPQEISQLLDSIPHSEEAYYKLRNLDTSTLNEMQFAARFIFLMKSCFNGVYRTNKAGKFNTPFGKAVYSLPTAANLEFASNLLRKSKIILSDFSDVLARSSNGDFIYVDPPYPATKDRGEYGYHSFNREEMHRLSDSLEKATDRGAKILLSFVESDWVNGLYKNWSVHQLSARRSVSASVQFRGNVTELILKNY